jgi:membrane associated rhomboid family serine protease
MNGFLDDFKNAFNKPDNGLVQIIIINLIVFVALIVLRVVLVLSNSGEYYQFILYQLTLPASLENYLRKPWSIITYFFTHEDFFHILFNLLFLYWFGRIIREFLGNRRVIALYALGGLAGGLFYMLIYNLLPFFSGRVTSSEMLGASAGVYAIVVGAATFMPNFTFFLLFLGPVKIKYIALFYVILSFANTIGDNAGGQLAHLGGALVGFLYIVQLKKGNDWGKPVYGVMNFFQKLFTRKPKIKVTHSSGRRPATGYTRTSTNRSNTNSGSIDQKEIDAILDKISEKGYDSLTKEEKEKLFNASK